MVVAVVYVVGLVVADTTIIITIADTTTDYYFCGCWRISMWNTRERLFHPSTEQTGQVDNEKTYKRQKVAN